jgi:hypothetical protein
MPSARGCRVRGAAILKQDNMPARQAPPDLVEKNLMGLLIPYCCNQE